MRLCLPSGADVNVSPDVQPETIEHLEEMLMTAKGNQMAKNNGVLAILEASGLGDIDQRSALGMARTWLEKHEAFVPSPHTGFQKRDTLAQALIDHVSEMDHDEAVAELAGARKVINEPHARAEFVGTAKAKKVKEAK